MYQVMTNVSCGDDSGDVASMTTTQLMNQNHLSPLVDAI
jgi:hypothetical protein